MATRGKKNVRIVESFPLRIERCGQDGWFFVACDGIPGLSAFGPVLEELFENMELAGVDLLRERGKNVISLKVEAVPSVANDCSWAEANKFELKAAA